jgi:hypothetical protein
MRLYTWVFLLLTLTALFRWVAEPAVAQDGDDGCGCTEIDMGDDEDEEDDEEELEKQRKKNAGLAGGGGGRNDDANAPKVKMSLQQQINKAIKAGVKYLKTAQAKDGSFPSVTANRDYKTGKDLGTRYRDELGPTAWAIYTLAKCGVKKNDPAIRKGMKYIFDQTKYMYDEMGQGMGQGQFGGRPERQKVDRKFPRTTSTYEVAAIIMMIEAVYTKSAKLTGKHKTRKLESDNPLKPPSRSKIPKDVWKYMHNRILFLTTGRRGGGKKGRTIKGLQVASGPNKGGWRYGPGNDADLSATQFALLALRAASQAGYPVEKVSKNVWRDAAAYVKACQRPSGGFTYQKQGSAMTGSMAGCGVGCLLICKEQMLLAGQQPPSWMDSAIKKGMDWLDKNFIPNGNPGGKGHTYYYLYGVERVGDLSGRKEFNGKDWYVRGAQFLLSQQDEASGKWVAANEFPPRDINGTTLALLFLKRATPPTVTMSEG